MPFLSVNSKDLYYVHKTPHKSSSKGLTFLLIHGLGSSSSFYAPVMTQLVRAGFSCLAFDTHGSCLSKYTGKQQDIESIASDAIDLLKTLGVPSKTVIAVGHSMGGMVVSRMATRLDIIGAVLIGPVTPGPLISEVFVQRIRDVEQNGMEALADAIPVAATGTDSTSLQHAFIRALLLSQNPEGYISLCQAIVSAELPEYSRIQCPALFIAGQDDKTAPLKGVEEQMRSWSDGTSSAELKILPGVGHWHCIEAGDEVSLLVADFAEQLRG